jgi:hypothetical protein
MFSRIKFPFSSDETPVTAIESCTCKIRIFANATGSFPMSLTEPEIVNDCDHTPRLHRKKDKIKRFFLILIKRF